MVESAEKTEDVEGEGLTAEELRDAWPVLDSEERLEGFHLLPRDDAEDFFLELSSRGQASVLLGMPTRERRAWLRLLPPDDVADLCAEFPPDGRGELCSLLDDPTRREVNALLAYAEDEAGGLMNPRFARARPEMTVEEAIRYVRRQAQDKLETIYYTYVLDHEQRLLGVVSFRELLLAPGDKLVRDVMHEDVITVPEEMDQEAVARIIAQHDILAVPVVDAERRVKGIVTVDDVVDVVETEATEDIQKIGGTVALDAPYMQTSVAQMIKKRAGWLMVLLVGQMFTISALSLYQEQFATAIVLVTFLPMIISSGGNSGSQATTLVIRAMALGQVRLRDSWRIVRRELVSGLFLGGLLALLGLARIVVGEWLAHEYGSFYLDLGLAVGISLLAVVMLGTLTGALLPLLLRALRFDPASASAPMVATMLDLSGVLIYFNVARVVLAGKLL
ncbi:MAG: magnesium transporter [Planctomycetes bacterium]|nr:magnesium transporter [Planctomycetota bacterium]